MSDSDSSLNAPIVVDDDVAAVSERRYCELELSASPTKLRKVSAVPKKGMAPIALSGKFAAAPSSSHAPKVAAKPATALTAPAAAYVPTPRNSKGWSGEQDIALLTEVIEGETFVMVKPKGRKVEERTLVKRAQGIPHGCTGQYWDAIIEKLESANWTTNENARLFPISLKRDYVSNRFDKLVVKRIAQLEKRKANRTKKYGVNDEDFVTGSGDDSEGTKEVRNSMDEEEKMQAVQIDELIDAYLGQQKAFKDEEMSTFNVSSVFDNDAGAEMKRVPSGQKNEDQDQNLIEKAASGASKKSQLPKLPLPTHVERSQAQALEHSSSMSKSFMALAESQKPQSVEDFAKKTGAVIEQSGKAIGDIVDKVVLSVGSSVEKGFEAYARYKRETRACIHADGHDFQVVKHDPVVCVCKRCGNVINA